MEVLVVVLVFLAIACVMVLLRVTQAREVRLQSSLQRRGLTVLKSEIDGENEALLRVHYRDKDYNLYIATYELTWTGVKKIEERIMRNHNPQFVEKDEYDRWGELK